MTYSSIRHRITKERRNKPPGNYSTKGVKKSGEPGKARGKGLRAPPGTYRSGRVLGGTGQKSKRGYPDHLRQRKDEEKNLLIEEFYRKIGQLKVKLDLS